MWPARNRLSSDRLHQLLFLNCDTAFLIRFFGTSWSRVSVSRHFLERLVSSQSWRLNVSVLRVERLGLEGWPSRSCDLTSCGHPWHSALAYMNYVVSQDLEVGLRTYRNYTSNSCALSSAANFSMVFSMVRPQFWQTACCQNNTICPVFVVTCQKVNNYEGKFYRLCICCLGYIYG